MTKDQEPPVQEDFQLIEILDSPNRVDSKTVSRLVAEVRAAYRATFGGHARGRMSKTLVQTYMQLEDEVLRLRTETGLDDPSGYEELADQMEGIWEKLSEVEQAGLRASPSRTWPDEAIKRTQ